MKIRNVILICAIIFLLILILQTQSYAVEQTKFSIEINKVDEDYNKIAGGIFEIVQDANTLSITTDNNGTFTSEEITITSENQEFVFEITEITAPSGYVKLNNPFRLRVKTGLNHDKTAYIIYEATLEDMEGKEILRYRSNIRKRNRCYNNNYTK